MDSLVKRNLDGSTEGFDPRSLNPSELTAGGGHSKKPLLTVIREKCLDCCCGVVIEVRRCTATKCPLWPYRMGTNPFAVHPGGAQNFAGRTASK